ncbi:MAG: beta-lactamase family protein, partial [Acidobacteriota bacterium]|nr:beta-lactamase family protein [Acidobacteriota bacterium]
MAMPKLPLLLLVLAFTLPTRAAAQWPAAAVGSSSPTQPAFDGDRLRRIDTFFQRHVDESRIGGAVVLVLQDGRPVYERAFGWSDKEAGRRMSPDSIFRIASQSKALTSVGILSLMEEGKLG